MIEFLVIFYRKMTKSVTWRKTMMSFFINSLDPLDHVSMINIIWDDLIIYSVCYIIERIVQNTKFNSKIRLPKNININNLANNSHLCKTLNLLNE